MHKNLLICFFFLLLIASCKDEVDNQSPSINLSSPIENQSFEVLESILVTGQATDNMKLEQVSISVYETATNRIILSPVIYNPQVTSFPFAVRMPISDSLLPSGSYYVKATAFDGETESIATRNITIGGIDKRRIDILYAQVTGASSQIKAINSAGNQRSLFSTSSSCRKLEMNSYDQTLWYASNTNHLLAYQLNEDELILDQRLANGGIQPFISDLQVYNRKAYYATRSGELRAYSANLSSVFNYQSELGKYVRSFLPGEKFVLIDEVLNGPGPNEVASLFQISGAKNASSLNSKTLLSFAFLPTGVAQFASQVDSTVYFTAFDPETGLSNEFQSRQMSVFASGLSISADEWLFYGAHGMYYYNQRSQFLKEIGNRLNVNDLDFDPIAGEAIVATGSEVRVYAVPSGAQIDSYSAGSAVTAVAVRYNY